MGKESTEIVRNIGQSMNPGLRDKIFYTVQKISRRNYLNVLQELCSTQHFESERLRRSQFEKLKGIVSFAYREIPYYRNLFERLRIKPGDINDFRSFSEIPILTREIVRNNFETLHPLDYQKRKYSRYVTSGATGEPLTIDIGNVALDYYRAAQYRGFSWYGIAVGDPGVKLWGVPSNTGQKAVEQLKDLFMNRTRFSAFDLSEKQLFNYYQKFKKVKPKYIYGYASALTHFARFIKEKNLNIAHCRPKVVISTSEVLYPHQRELISSTFGCLVANEYGCVECGIIAFECPQGHLHITSENVYLEVVNQDTQGIGELIITGLVNRTMPLIRYRLGDLAKINTLPCDCEITLPGIEIIAGRSNDIIKTPEGKIIHCEMLDYINRSLEKNKCGLKEYKIIQKAINHLLVLVAKDNYDERKIVELFTEQIRKNVSEQISMNFKFVKKIPPEKSGKIRYFISEI